MNCKKRSKFAQRLIAARKAQGLRQKDLAAKIGVMEHTVTGWENDKVLPRVESLIDIANALSVSLDWLLGRRD